LVVLLALMFGIAMGKSYPEYTVRTADSAGSAVVRFCASDSLGVYYAHDLDIQSKTPDSDFASITTSSDGRLHVVWASGGSIVYSGTTGPMAAMSRGQTVNPEWLEERRLTPSTPDPAVSPRVEARGDTIAVSWLYARNGVRDSAGYWQRTGFLLPGTSPEWLGPVLVSRRRQSQAWR
jgi:hypothetical protein